MIFPITNPIMTIPGISVYYDSRNINGNNSQPAIGAISQFVDLSGQQNTALQATGALQPSYNYSSFNFPSVAFGGSQNMVAGDSHELNVSTMTNFIVSSTSNRSGGLQGSVTKDISSGISNPPYGFGYDTGVDVIDFSLTGNTTATINISDSTVSTIAFISGSYDGTTLSAYVNNTLSSTATSGTIATTTGSLQVGQQKAGSSRFLTGNIFIYVLFGRALSSAEQNVLRLNMANIFGLALNTI